MDFHGFPSIFDDFPSDPNVGRAQHEWRAPHPRSSGDPEDLALPGTELHAVRQPGRAR